MEFQMESNPRFSNALKTFIHFVKFVKSKDVNVDQKLENIHVVWQQNFWKIYHYDVAITGKIF